MATAPTPVEQLRAIAAQLEAMHEAGDFALCFEHVRADMATLPDRLAELADIFERSNPSA